MKVIARVNHGGHIVYVQRWERDASGRLFVVYTTLESQAEVFVPTISIDNQAISEIERLVSPSTLTVIPYTERGEESAIDPVELRGSDSMGWEWETPLKEPIVAPEPLQEATGPLLSDEERKALLEAPNLDLDGPDFEFAQGITYTQWRERAKQTLASDMNALIANQLSLFSQVEIDPLSTEQFQSLPDLLNSLIGSKSDWEAWFNNDKTD
jgi:hypothetical protein